MERGGEVMGQPKSGRIAVKVINHLGDEVMKMRVAVIICLALPGFCGHLRYAG
jgi:hypothetical protein